MTVSSEQGRHHWYQNPIVGLGIMFLIPALLVLGGFYVVGLYGQIPGGSTTVCERDLGDGSTARIEVYGYTAGLTYYERQTFAVSSAVGSWETVFEDEVQVPRGVNCEDHIRVLTDGTWLFFNSKSVALNSPQRDGWQVHHVCDDPRPEQGRCDADPLNITDVQFVDGQQGTLLIQEGVVDEYGQPLFENGAPRLLAQYQLQTEDGGRSWQLVEGTDG